MRFAGNSLFGNGYNGVHGAMNKLIDKYKDKFNELCTSNDFGDLIGVMNELIGKQDSAEINNYFFSLKDNASVREKQVVSNFDYNAMLQQDQHFQLVVLLFYSALMFHIAKMTKAKGLNPPRHIAFSGNGSKAIQILTTDMSVLSDYTKKIFEKVYGEPSSDKLEVLLESSPKELTCKGCLSDINNVSTKVDHLKVVYNSDGKFFDCNSKYQDIDESVYQGVEKEIREFFDMFIVLSEEFSFKNNFGIESHEDMNIVKDNACQDMRTFIMKGIQNKNVSQADDIEETLFFNYFNGALNSLTTKLV